MPTETSRRLAFGRLTAAAMLLVLVARLVHAREGRELPPSARLLVGRSPACGLRLEPLHVSSEHATLEWTGVRWEVRDLGSRNGTFLDGRRLPPGRAEPLEAGARVGFGDPDDPWVLADASPPRLMALHLDRHEVVEATGGLLVLPADGPPEVSLYGRPDAGWVAERGLEEPPTPLRDHGVVHTARGAYQIELPRLDRPPDPPPPRLSLSLRERPPTAELEVGDRRRPVEPHHAGAILVALGLARAQDADRPEPERGWRGKDALARAAGLDPAEIGPAIHAARRCLLEAGVTGAARVVEARRAERRLGPVPFDIV